MAITSDPKHLDDAAPAIQPFFEVEHEEYVVHERLMERSVDVTLRVLQLNTATRTKLTVAKLCASYFDCKGDAAAALWDDESADDTSLL